MHRIVALALQLAPVSAPAQRIDPAADYITSGQDEPGYRAWIAADPARAPSVAAFHAFLTTRGVAGIVPTWQLLRTATDWQRCAAQPFDVAPQPLWPNLVETLAYVRAHVVPVIGEVEPVSVYRNPVLNACAHGAPESAHTLFFAMDMVPLRPTSRDGLVRGLCAIHLWRGTGYDVGLGFYKGLRFHIDSKKFRKWGGDGRGDSSPCAALMAELDAAAKGPAMPTASATSPISEPAVR